MVRGRRVAANGVLFCLQGCDLTWVRGMHGHGFWLGHGLRLGLGHALGHRVRLILGSRLELRLRSRLGHGSWV